MLEKTLESPKEIQPVHLKEISPEYSLDFNKQCRLFKKSIKHDVDHKKNFFTPEKMLPGSITIEDVHLNERRAAICLALSQCDKTDW